MYLRMSALRTVRLPSRANVPAQRTRRTNAFAVARGDKTAMRPFAKSLWIVVFNFDVDVVSVRDFSFELINIFALE